MPCMHKMMRQVLGYSSSLAFSFGLVQAESVDLSWKVPHNVAPSTSLPVQEQHRQFSDYAWKVFVAVNWPSDSAGNPIKNETIGAQGDNDTVWQHWIDSQKLFGEWEPGQVPEWNELRNVEKGLGIKVLKRMTANHLSQIEQPGMGPLVDQNGEFVYYEVLLNRVMFETIKRQGLYTENGQAALPKDVDFPCGKDKGTKGAMLIKAAWKVLEGKDDIHKFHHKQALIDPPGGPKRRVTVGLVGLHITHKTSRSPQWNWITFDHVLNAPHYSKGKLELKYDHYSFFDTEGTHQPKDFNIPPDQPWDLGGDHQPTQLVRLATHSEKTLAGGPNFIDKTLKEINASYRKALSDVSEKSVWKYYQLVGVQWPFEAPVVDCEVNPANPLGTPLPDILANVVIESYQQGVIQGDKNALVPHGSSSCIHCHSRAMATQGRFSDYTFTLGHAKPLVETEEEEE